MEEERASEFIDKSKEAILLSYIRVKNKVERIRVVAVREQPDLFYAAALSCVCEKDSCELLKTGFLFPTDTEALEYGKAWLKEICARKDE
jgi:hypothetical protein